MRLGVDNFQRLGGDLPGHRSRGLLGRVWAALSLIRGNSDRHQVIEWLADVVRGTTNAVTIIDIQGRVLWINDGFTRIYGYNAEEILGRVVCDVLKSPRTDQGIVDELHGRLADGRGYQGELLKRAKDGREYWVLLDIQPRLDAAGNVVGFMAIESDITDRKLAQVTQEQALMEQAERTELALAGGDLGTWDWEFKANTLTVDARWASMVGETLDSVGNTTEAWSSRVHPDDLPACLEQLKDYVQHGVPYQDVLFRMRHREGGWRWIRASGKVVAWHADGEPIRMVGTHADVTDWVVSEFLRDKSNQRMELAIQAGRMGLWDWNLDTGEFTIDARWAAILGEQPDELLPDASTLFTRVHPDDLEALEADIHGYSVGERPQIDVQIRLSHRDGSWRWARFLGKSTSVTVSQEGSRLVGILMDVHEQVTAQVELARREAVMANTVRMAGIGGWELDLRTMTLHWSDQVRVIHEVPSGYVPKLDSAIEFYEGEAREQIAECVRRAIDHGEAYDIECRFVTAMGRRRWVRSVGEPVYAEGKVVRLAGALQDITEQRAQHEALEEANRALEAAQMISRMGSWNSDAATHEVAWSRHMFHLFDLSPVDVTPSTELALSQYIEEDSARLATAIKSALTDGTPYALTLRRREDRNGVRHVAVEGRARRDASGCVTGLYGTARDVTSEVEREAALREARLRAEDASRSKTEFLANMSHEIRTPMTAILGYADLLDDTDLTENQRAEHTATIKRNGEHLLAIINDILDISKIEAGRMVVEQLDTSPRDVLLGVAQLMRVKADAKGLDIAIECATDVPTLVRTDPTRLRQILMNLMGNAIKFTEHGRVSVSMGFAASATGGTLWIEVRDTGIGMMPEQVEHAFTAFTQADASMTRRFGGTGLGLRISKRLAAVLGGDITVTSAPGEGSVFTVSIDAGTVGDAGMVPAGPVTLGAMLPSRDRHSTSMGTPLAGVRVLLMEDGLDNLRLISTHLRRAGAEVATARDGRLGLKKLTADAKVEGPLRVPEPFDAIVTDMQMPEIDGYTAVRMLRDKGCRLPIVALTAHAMPGDRERCLEAGCDAYAAKPVTRGELVEVLLEAMAVRAR